MAAIDRDERVFLFVEAAPGSILFVWRDVYTGKSLSLKPGQRCFGLLLLAVSQPPIERNNRLVAEMLAGMISVWSRLGIDAYEFASRESPAAPTAVVLRKLRRSSL